MGLSFRFLLFLLYGSLERQNLQVDKFFSSCLLVGFGGFVFTSKYQKNSCVSFSMRDSGMCMSV